MSVIGTLKKIFSNYNGQTPSTGKEIEDAFNDNFEDIKESVNDVDERTEDLENSVVKHSEQTLLNSEKSQARSNIGAFATADVVGELGVSETRVVNQKVVSENFLLKSGHVSANKQLEQVDYNILKCIKSIEILDDDKSRTENISLCLNQMGWSSSNFVVFAFEDCDPSGELGSPRTPSASNGREIQARFYDHAGVRPSGGVHYYEGYHHNPTHNPATTYLKLRLRILFDWDVYNQLFPTAYYPIFRQTIRVDAKKDIRINSIDTAVQNILEDVQELDETVQNIDENALDVLLLSRGFAKDSFRSEKNYAIARCFHNLKIQSVYGVTKMIVYQGGWSPSSKYTGFHFHMPEVGFGISARFANRESRPTGVEHFESIETLGTGWLSFDFDWDYFNEKFPTDLFRPTAGDVEPLYIYSESIPEFKVSNSVRLKPGAKILAVGASFITYLNGWFELASLNKGLVPVNKAAGATQMYNNVAQKMLDANESQPHGSLFMHGGVDIFDDVEAIVIMHATNQRIYPRDHESKTIAEHKATGVGTDNILAFDYVIKQYKQWCAEITVQKPDGEVIGSKPCNIILCSHWLPSRTIYNYNSKLLAKKHGISYCDFQKEIGITKDDIIRTTINYDGQPTPIEGDYNRSILYAAGLPGKVETIDGVMWGWHMQLRSDTFNYGNGQESDGYYYSDVQYIMSEIFQKCLMIK